MKQWLFNFNLILFATDAVEAQEEDQVRCLLVIAGISEYENMETIIVSTCYLWLMNL